jgi:hypothetical protein
MFKNKLYMKYKKSQKGNATTGTANIFSSAGWEEPENLSTNLRLSRLRLFIYLYASP